MKFLRFLSSLILVVAVAACNEKNDPNGGFGNRSLSVTVGADHISAVSAVFNGKANLGKTVSADLIVGFQYSKSAGILPSNSTTIEAEDADANYNYSAKAIGLEPATKYYFRSFVSQNEQDTYGETKEFTTKDVASMIGTKDATDVDAISARLNAMLDLTDVLYNKMNYGFTWGTSESFQNRIVYGGEAIDMSYSTVVANLSYETQYWYKAFLKLDDQIFYGDVKSFITGANPVIGVSLNKTQLNLAPGTSQTLIATVSPFDATNKAVTWSSSNISVATVSSSGVVVAKAAGTATIKVTTNDGGKTATCKVTVQATPEAVDLGLTSGLKWASCNVGATAPYEYGDYFAWGEIETYYEAGYAQSNKPVWKSNKSRGYCWQSYKWCSGSARTQTKYCISGSYGTVDNMTVLDLEDDAASVNCGCSWRMPTDAEWTELRTECTWNWTTQDGVNGMLVTGPNGNKIFLPAAGYRYNASLNVVGKGSYYWSSSLMTDYTGNAWRIYFDSDDVGEGSGRDRCYGFSVRPVTE